MEFDILSPDEEIFLVNTLEVKQDVGGPYPVYRRVTLYLWSDGSVTWKPDEGVRIDS